MTMTKDTSPDAQQFVPTHKGFLMSWRALPDDTMIMDMESVEGVHSTVRAKANARFIEAFDRLFNDRPETWFEFLVDDGKMVRFHNEPRRAPRNETIHGYWRGERELGNGLIELGLADEEGLCRNATIHIPDDFQQSYADAITGRMFIEIDVDSNLEVTALRSRNTDPGNAT